MDRLTIGILAHVDAGKTTLAEGLLFQAGVIGKLGRVDHQNTFLDTYSMERKRGITIFSKQAILELENVEVTLLDTPGHVDFSTEMERTLQVLDYAILIVSGSDGVQGHTETLGRLLKYYQVPTFIFINKMDLERADKEERMEELKARLGEGCVDFSKQADSQNFYENIAMCHEDILEYYIENGTIPTEMICLQIQKRKIFPCFFGSALKNQGITQLIEGIQEYMLPREYQKEFGAKVFKISRDDLGNRITFLKITGGSIQTKQLIADGEKIEQIRVYSGEKYEIKEEVPAGTICGVMGLKHTYPGEGLGMEPSSELPLLEPVLRYKVSVAEGTNMNELLSNMRKLEEEDPLLHVTWSEENKEIQVGVMGEIQIEVLKAIMEERFQIEVAFVSGSISYKETLEESVIGVGHFEPLRHYAEVHLQMEPGELGSGIQLFADCSEDMLDGNFQRLIVSHLEERVHVGVLTGSPITDMKITVIAGRSHQKHTEGGDFRQATYRALRQGLKQGKCKLLEPFYQIRLEVPTEFVGRAMSDIQQRSGEFLAPELDGEMSIITGSVPVATMAGYQQIVASYTGGKGRLSCNFNGYAPCHNQEEVRERINYDSESDLENPTGSVFCQNGAGFLVPWDQVKEYQHLESKMTNIENEIEVQELQVLSSSIASSKSSGTWQEDKELEAIFVRTFGEIKRKRLVSAPLGQETLPKRKNLDQTSKRKVSAPKLEDYLLVDGYNIIFAWPELKGLAQENLEGARSKLMDILCNYQGFTQCHLVVVFDAYRVKGSQGKVEKYHNIHVVYTKEAETADSYIEKVTKEIGRTRKVIVATSDALEQLIIMGQGAYRWSANDFREEIFRVGEQIRKEYLENDTMEKSFLGEILSEEIVNFFLNKTE